MRILAESTTLHEAIPKILQAICESLDWALGEFWAMDSKTNELRFVEAWHKPSVKVSEFEAQGRQITFSPGSGLIGSVYASRKPVWITDVVNDANFHRAEIAIKEGLRGAMGFPIMAGNEVLGVFVFLCHEIQQADEYLLPMLTSIGGQIGQFIKRKQAEEYKSESLEKRVAERTKELVKANEELQVKIAEHKMTEDALYASEARYRGLFENAPVSLWELDSSEVKTYLDSLQKSGIADFRTYFESHPEAAHKCAAMVRIIDVNKATLQMYQAKNKQYFLRCLTRFFDRELFDVYKKALVVLSEGQALFETEAVTRTLGGSENYVFMRLSIAPGYEQTWERVFISLVDITERKRMEEALRESEASLAKAQQIAHLGSWELDIRKNKAYWSDEVYRIFGLVPQSFVPTCETFLNYVHPDDREFVKKSIHDALNEGKPYRIDHRIVLPDGSVRIVHEQGEVIADNTGRVIRMSGTVQDITERKWIEDALKRRIGLEMTIATISTRFVILSDFNNTIYKSLADAGRFSKAGRAYLFQFRDNGTIMDNTHEWCDEGVTPEIQHLRNLPTAMFPWWMENLRAGNVIHIPDVSKMPPERDFEKAFLEKQGIKSLLVLPIYAEADLVGFLGFDNVVTAGPWHEEDITLLRIMAEILGSTIARKRSEALITYMAYHDTLTSLPNRNLLKDRIQVAVVHAKRNKSMAAVMVLDLDNFKTINDMLGHHVGDLLLKAVAERLKRCVREGDTVARTGGDEFTVVLYDLVHVEDAATVAQKFLDALYQPFQIEGHEVNITTSIGISLYPLDAEETETLVKNADIAMYLSKEHGKNTYRFYKSDMNTHV
ncbi:MAG: diguanylate cyclase domain-containing protein [Candidatus Brocadia sp.]